MQPVGDPGCRRHPAGKTATRRQVLAGHARALVRAIQDGDEAKVEAAVVGLSRSRRTFAPLVFAVGAFVMLFQGLRLPVSNWRLTLIPILPAMWIWAAMLNLKLHVFKGEEFRSWYGWAAVALVAAIALVTAASFYLNAVFAFAISRPGPPEIRPAFELARRHLGVVLGVGLIVGVALGISSAIVPRWGSPWVLLVLGATLHAGATGAVKALKMSAKLAAGKVSQTQSPSARPDAV